MRVGVAALAAVALTVGAGAVSTAAAAAPPPGVIPQPAVEVAGAGALTLGPGALIATPAGDAAAAADARWLAEEVARDRGLALRTGAGGPASVRIERVSDPALGAEGYRLDVDAGGVRLQAASDAGLFDGTATLLQLMTPQDGRRGAVAIPAVHIEDSPRFAWRGLMLDSARHMQSIGFIEALIDQMARYKLNVLHWHLTDDQGWRLQIKAWPRLTEVGGWRADAGAPGGRYGGFYTQDQVRGLVAYAQARNVTIVPEIEMPGHASAALLAYPQFGLRPVDPATLGDWGVFPNLYAPTDASLTFLESVLDEVMTVFPSRYIHVGGDEAIKDYWRASPTAQAQLKALGLKDEDALQAWFMGRIGAYLHAHGRRMVGWDEILQGELPPGATVMSWRGADGALAAAKAGHDAILTPGKPFYLDNRQSDAPDEPPSRGLVIPLRDVYAFQPEPPSSPPTLTEHLLGVQGSLFTEYVTSDAQVEHMAFPREIAVAEMAWSQPARRSWPGFLARLPAALSRDQALGLAPARSAFEVRPYVEGDGRDGPVTVALSTQAGLGDIRFTLDGSPPSPASRPYTAPFQMTAAGVLAAQAFAGAEALGPVTRQALDPVALRTRDNHDLALCSERLSLNLPGDAAAGRSRPVFLLDVADPCWIWKGADLAHVGGVTAGVGRTPFNLQFGDDPLAVAIRPAGEGVGALQVRLDGCSGELVATLPLTPSTGATGVDTLTAPLRARAGRHDLCFTFTRRGVDPIWALSWVRLDAGAAS